MPDELIPVIDGATRLGTHKQTVFKVLKRLGISTTKQRSSAHRNQVIAFITEEDLARVAQELSPLQGQSSQQTTDTGELVIGTDTGVFYLIQLEPDHDPGCFKVGFATSMPDRLRTLRCSAPFATVLRTWPCKVLWERTAMDCVAAGCDRLHTEIFRTESLDAVVTKCEQFFALMPQIDRDTGRPTSCST